MGRPVIKNGHQGALYASESVLDHQGRVFHRTAEIQAYVDDLVRSQWFYDRWPSLEEVKVVRRSSGATWSCAFLDCAHAGTLALTRGDHGESTVLHELAHLVTDESIGHGPGFAEAYLSLVRHKMGFVAFTDLLYTLRATEEFRYIEEGVRCDA